MIRRRHFHEGDAVGDFTADDYREIVRELRRLAALTVTGGLTLEEHPAGRVLGRDGDEPIFATLSGSANPYSFTEAISQTGGTWATGYTTGTNAYEVNGKTGLNGKVVWLRPTPAGDWRFDAECLSCGCDPATSQICVNVTDNCTPPQPIPGATVVIKLTSDGSTVDSGTTDASGQFCIPTPNADSYDITVSLTGFTDQTQTAVVACDVDASVSFAFGGDTCTGGRFCATVADTCSPSHVIGSATVTATDGSGTEYTCTTDGVGQCCIDVPKSCMYSLKASVLGAESATQKVMGVCDTDWTDTLTIDGVGTTSITFYECDETDAPGDPVGHLVSGATFELSNGTNSASATSDASGVASLTVGAGDYTATVTWPDGGTASFAMTVVACETASTSVTKLKTQCFTFGSGVDGCEITVTLSGDTTGTCSFTYAAGTSYQCCITLDPPLLSYPGSPVANVTYTLTTSGGWNNTVIANYPLYCRQSMPDSGFGTTLFGHC